MQQQKQINLQLTDNTSLGITIFPADQQPAPLLLINPAFGIKATYYARFAQQLSEAGITTVTADLRGHGLSSVRPSKNTNYGSLEMINDLKIIFEALKIEYPSSKIYVLGHSYGGQVASLAIAKYPTSYDGLAMIGSPNVYYKGWADFHYYRRKIMLFLLPIVSSILSILPLFKIGGYYTTNTQIEEYGYTGKTGDFKVIGDELDYEQAIRKVTIPILAINIEDDLMAPKAAVALLYTKFINTKALTTLTLTKTATHPKLSHINWPRTADKMMVKVITDWLYINQ